MIQDPQLILRVPFQVSSAETDMYGRARLSALINLLIQSSILSADRLGFGYRHLQPLNLFWVLSRISIEIAEPLRWNNSGETETWPKSLDRLMYLRDFFIRDSRGLEVVKATSGWLTVDATSKRSRLDPALDVSPFELLKNRHALSSLPDKLSGVDGEVAATVTSAYYDIDINQHVTTTRYFDWMMDTFPPEFHQKNYPVFVAANFLREIKPGEIIQIRRAMNSNNAWHFEGYNASRQIIAFRGVIRFGEE